METIVLREKTTSPISMQLLSDGDAIDLTGVHHVRLDMIDSKGKTYKFSSLDVPNYVDITNASTGSVRFVPPNENTFTYLRSPYKGYWWVFNTASQQYSCPEEGYFEIKLEKEY